MNRHRSTKYSTYIIFISAMTICIKSADNYLGEVINLIQALYLCLYPVVMKSVVILSSHRRPLNPYW